MSEPDLQEQPTLSEPAPKNKLARRGIVLGLILAAFASYNVGCSVLAQRWSNSVPRHADTNVMIGAEELHLGPEDASSAVLLVHGFVGGSNNFAELPQRLAVAGYHVHAMRVAGHGTSPQEQADTSAEELKASVRDAIDSLKNDYERVFVIGHSMGCAISVIETAAAPVDGLVLGAPYFGVTHKWYYGLTPEMWNALTSPIVRWTFKGDPFIRIKRKEVRPQIFSYKWIHSNSQRALIALGKEAREPEVLSKVHHPVLMFVAPDDHAADPKRAEAAFEIISSEDKSLVRLMNSDHNVYWDYEREFVNEEILNFLARLSENSETSDSAE